LAGGALSGFIWIVQLVGVFQMYFKVG